MQEQTAAQGRRFERTRVPGIYRRGRVYVAKFRDGQGRQRQVSGKTLAEAKRLRAEALTDVSRGEFAPPGRLTFGEYVERFVSAYQGRSGRGIRPGTLRDYERSLRRHVLPTLGQRRLTSITLTDLRALSNMLTDQGIAPSTVRNIAAAVKAVLAEAHEAGIVRFNPTAGWRLPMPERGKVRHLEPGELERLHAETPEEWRLWVRLLAYTGCRIGEFVELRWRDLDLDAGTLTIERRLYRGTVDRPKSAYGVRTLPVTRELVAELRRHKMASRYSSDDDPIFSTAAGTPHNPSNTFRRVVKPAAERAGVGWAGHHTLRHTCGTLLARAGLRAEEIQAWLGHHAASFTQDTYIGRPKSLPDPNQRRLDSLAG